MTSTLTVPRFTLTVDGTDYEAEPAVCEDFHLGAEDHGIYTALISFTGPGWGQGLPARGLDEYDKRTKERIGTAFGMDFIIQATRVLGSPEDAKGARVVVLRKPSGHLIDGFARLHDDGSIGDPFIPATLAARHYPAVSA